MVQTGAPDESSSWPVVLADYVTSTDGTGLVHTAPAFGADDHRTGLEFGLHPRERVDMQRLVHERLTKDAPPLGVIAAQLSVLAAELGDSCRRLGGDYRPHHHHALAFADAGTLAERRVVAR